MYNSLHYTYYLYIVMYYRNNLVSLGKNMTNLKTSFSPVSRKE